MLIIAALVEGSHALHDFALSNPLACSRRRIAGYQWPLSDRVVGGGWFSGSIGPRLICLFAPGGAIALAAVAGVIRWTVAAFTTSPVILAFIQPLHGFTFALLHLAAMQVIAQVCTAPFGRNGTSHLRHTVHRAGYGRADAGFRPSIWLDGRNSVSRHGRALSAGAAVMRPLALTRYAGVSGRRPYSSVGPVRRVSYTS